MKKQVLSFALVAAMIGSIAAGCSSTKKTDGSDTTSTTTTVKDSTSTMSTPTDTTKKDTTKTPPKM
ncbi:hypothetical protein BDD43_3355 [Mucilaginibacter gracilis]|uniref:Coproporphyrinogen III oxidase n=1 Tax=Mucilaginibacter gracilis TaxID=423350 RepID=A0A495J2V0_9SPHI|nr:hypothetical protein [Mucilaginibacter gracilis]RKR83153.1 hypothetical protein BDD43_3355 [Mucilaginibacter gracilis]